MSDNRTTELRDKLDALNIEHFDYDKGGRTQTQWEAPDGKRHFTYETSNNPAKTARLVIAWHPTPEQAIAATLGNETCDNENTDGYGFRFECSECGYSAIVHNCAVRLDELPNYCPNCGGKIVTP